MQNESELWYPIPDQSPENAQDFGTDTASDVPSKVQLPHNDNTQKFAKADDKEDVGPSDSGQLATLLHERIDRDDRARSLAREAEICNDFDDAVSVVFSGADATAEARQAFARFDPRDPDPQAFEFRNFVSPEYEKYGYF